MDIGSLDFTLAASTVPNLMNDAVADNLRKHWDEGEIVEMMGVVSDHSNPNVTMILVSLFGYFNRWNDSMGTEMESGAIESGEKYLQKKGRTVGKHKY